MTDDSLTVGRPALLWRVERTTLPDIECLSAATAAGRFRVWIAQEGRQDVGAVFDDPSDGVRWALEMERELLAQGWTKIP